MTEREKLIDLLIQSEIEAENDGFFNCSHSTQKAEFIADYLLSHGVYLRPCNIGDTVYLVLQECEEILEGKVSRLSINHKGELIIVIKRKQDKYYTSGNFKWSSFGKTVFYTKEEAEKTLLGKE